MQERLNRLADMLLWARSNMRGSSAFEQLNLLPEELDEFYKLSRHLGAAIGEHPCPSPPPPPPPPVQSGVDVATSVARLKALIMTWPQGERRAEAFAAAASLNASAFPDARCALDVPASSQALT